MRKRVLFLLAAALAAGAFASHAFSLGREARFVTFTAQNKFGIYLRDLKKDEVSVWLDGRPVKVVYFGYRDVDSAFVFMIENSPRTAPYANTVPQMGRVNIVDQVRYYLSGGFFDRIVPLGPVLLGEFYKAVKVLQGFTDQEDILSGALLRLQPHFMGLDKEHIAVGRALGRGYDLLRNRSEKRKVLVLFTRSVDLETYKNRREYLQIFQDSNIELYVVSFAVAFPTGAGYSFAERVNRSFFRELAGGTGGKAYISSEYGRLDSFMDDLKSRLANSYTIGFYVEPGSRPSEHKVRLKARSSDVEVTYREKLEY